MFKSLIRISGFVAKPNVAFGKNLNNSYVFKPISFSQPAFQLKAMRFTTETESAPTIDNQPPRQRRFDRRNNNNGERRYNKSTYQPKPFEYKHKNIVLITAENPSKEEILKTLGDATPKNLVVQQAENGRYFTFLTFENTSTVGQAFQNLNQLRRENVSKFGNYRNVPDNEVETIQSEIAKPSPYVKFLKLPFSFSSDDLKNLLSEYNVEDATVSNGVGVVKFSTPEEAARVITEKSGSPVVSKIRLIPTTGYANDFDYVSNNQTTYVRLRNFSSEIRYKDVKAFFDGFNVSNISMIRSVKGSEPGFTGAFVEFENHEDVARALEKNQTTLGSRVITINRSSRKEQKIVQKRIHEALQTRKNDESAEPTESQ